MPICCSGWSINQNVCPVSGFSSTFSGSLSVPNSPGLEFGFTIDDKTVSKRDVEPEAVDHVENITLPDPAAVADDSLVVLPAEVAPTKALQKRQYSP